MKKKITYLIQAIIIYFAFIISKILGLKLSRIIFEALFIILGPFFKSHKIVDSNLNRILPNINSTDGKIIKKKMWSNYGKTFVEYVFLNNFRKKNNHINIKNKKVLDEVLKKNNPVVFISGHFANFELMSMELTKAKINLATIYRPLNNIFLNPLMEFIRKKYICKNQIKKGISGVKDVMTYFKSNHSIALMVDQRVSEGEKISFFGYEAYTTTLPAQLALRFQCEIVPIYISRNNSNDFEMEFFEPIKPPAKGSQDEKNSISKKINKVVEQMVLRDPSQWILTHNRWK